jgi:8-oxo-dGTP pyrophosphatase MutT (NUDIX family)|tara:strand:+ start:94 stop:534 length:441 start_codon:yes stop_codon:yes gene_type:complete
MSLLNKFNVRVYGILEVKSRVLVTDEIKCGVKMTKFPGGGLEFGEGLKDAVRREYKEELNIEIVVEELIYINDFLQVSSFDKKDQLLCVYYRVKQVCNTAIETVNVPFGKLNIDQQCFRWLNKGELFEDKFTFPIDKVIAEKLRNE